MTQTAITILRTIYQTAILYAITSLAFHAIPLIVSSQLDTLLNRAAPDFSIPDISGRVVRLADYRGKHVLIDFWSAGVRTCLDDIPQLKALQETYGDDLVIVSITTDNSPSEIQQVVEREGITWTQIVASRAEADLLQRYSVEQIPSYHLVDPEGRLAHSGVGLLKTIRERGPDVSRGWVSQLILRVWGVDVEFALQTI